MSLKRWLFLPFILCAVARAGGAGGPARPALLCPATSGPAHQVNCVWKTPSGTLQIVGDSKNYAFRLTATDPRGKRLWQEQRSGQIIFGIREVDGVLIVDSGNNGAGAYISSRVGLVARQLEKPVWVAGGVLVFRPSDHLALFWKESIHVPDEAEGLNYLRVTLQPSINVEEWHLDSPSRSNCGETKGFYDQFGQPKFTQRYVYIARQDDCGRFMTRYDWVTPDAAPLVYPTQSTRP